jgi:hypothetical protein
VAKIMQKISDRVKDLGSLSKYKKILLALLVTIVGFIGLFFVYQNLSVLGSVANHKITEKDVAKLRGSTNEVTKKDKVTLLADSYLYDAILQEADSLYNPQKVKDYAFGRLAKENNQEKDNSYAQQKYLAEELETRVHRYWDGGFIASYILVRYDQNYGSKEFNIIAKDMLRGNEIKDEIAQNLTRGLVKFDNLREKIASQYVESGKKGVTVSFGKISKTGPTDGSEEQIMINQALNAKTASAYGNKVYGIDIDQNTAEGKFPGAFVIYRTDKLFPRQPVSYKEFTKAQKLKYGYEIY